LRSHIGKTVRKEELRRWFFLASFGQIGWDTGLVLN
jgi:hypothetical protein